MKLYAIIFTVLISIPCVVICGCANEQQGKFTDEQMQSIPYANKYDLPQATGGMTLGISSETITIDEILLFGEEKLKPYAEQTDRTTFIAQALPYIRETIKGKVTDILLYEEARKSAPENIDETISKDVEREVNRFVAGFDNNYALAERAIKQMGMDWKSFREYQRKLILTQSYLSSTLNEEKRFSFQDMLDFYESVKDSQFTTIGFVEFSVIDLNPSRLRSDQVEEGETAEAAAVRIANELIAKINTGADFAELAKEYSNGPFANQGGHLEPVTLGSDSLTEPYATLEKEALRMQPGHVKGPITLDNHVFLLRLDDFQEGSVRPFSEVQKQIEQQLQFQYQQQQYLKLVQKLVQKADAGQIEQFAQFCAKTAYDRWGRDR